MTLAAFSTAAMIMAGLGVGLATLLAIANKKLYVFEDPRIDDVEALLPSANCGACGKAGCRAFAVAAVAGDISPGSCTVNTAEYTAAIADYLGVDAGGEIKRVARLACAGGNNVAWTRARYEGLKTCRAAALVAGGGKGCSWGCLGLGDCGVVCEFDAITMNEHGLPVVDEAKCTACGDCVDICPKGLFSIEPVTHRLWVACKSLAEGDEAEGDCAVACTACGRCEADAPGGLVKVEHNLARVDYTRLHLASDVPIQRCPTGAIVWIDEKGTWHRGPAAKTITRKTPLPIQAGIT